MEFLRDDTKDKLPTLTLKESATQAKTGRGGCSGVPSVKADHTKKRHTERSRSKNALEAHLYENTASINFSSVFVNLCCFHYFFPSNRTGRMW